MDSQTRTISGSKYVPLPCRNACMAPLIVSADSSRPDVYASNTSATASTRAPSGIAFPARPLGRSEEHTSELQSHVNLVCRLLLEKKKKNKITNSILKKKDNNKIHN